MKNSFYTFILLILTTTILSAQGKIAQKSYQHFEPDDGGWITDSRENWEYDQADRETLYTTWNSYQGAYAPYNNMRLETVYRLNGQLSFQKNRSWGDTIWQETQTTYQYDSNDKLEEAIYKNEDSENEMISYQRSSYQEDLAANQQTRKNYYAMGTPENWLLEHQYDSFLNENNCVVKQVLRNYDALGNQTNERWTTTEVNENCQMQSSGYWLPDAATDSMYLFTQHHFSYSNGGQTQTDIYQRKNQQTNEWQTQHLVEKTVDEAGREVRYFYENYKTNYTDTVLNISTYTLQGELETLKAFKTAYQTNDKSLYLVRLDSFVYEYDEEGKLLQKDHFRQSYSNPIRQTTTRYTYYCNGQLKTEKVENLPHVSRIYYEYYGNADCFLLENEKPNLVVFPNPSNGNFKLQSNLLTTLGATIELHSVVGQLVYMEKVNRIAPTFNLELSELPKGQYILTIRNAKETMSEKVVIR